MVPALLLVLGCWRPDAYTPPAAPPEDAPEEEAPGDAPDDAPDDPPTAAEGDEAETQADPPSEAADAEPDAPPPFPAYAARTLQAPVTLVDDYGKPLAVLNVAGAILEVRGEEDVRTLVWCGSCTPAVEGWIQAHLVERTNAGPTGGSK